VSNTNDGGQAFPHISRWMQEFTDDGRCVGCYPTGGGLGMTLRDYFAAKAMSVLMSCPDQRRISMQRAEAQISSSGKTATIAEADAVYMLAMAQRSYIMADLMLAEREAKP
jgi:hypothetical protein